MKFLCFFLLRHRSRSTTNPNFRRKITKAPERSDLTPVLAPLPRWPLIKFSSELEILLITQQALDNLAPPFISKFQILLNSIRPLRTWGPGLFVVLFGNQVTMFLLRVRTRCPEIYCKAFLLTHICVNFHPGCNGKWIGFYKVLFVVFTTEGALPGVSTVRTQWHTHWWNSIRVSLEPIFTWLKATLPPHNSPFPVLFLRRWSCINVHVMENHSRVCSWINHLKQHTVPVTWLPNRAQFTFNVEHFDTNNQTWTTHVSVLTVKPTWVTCSQPPYVQQICSCPARTGRRRKSDEQRSGVWGWMLTSLENERREAV